MNTDSSNILSRIEREYASFLYDNARRSSNHTVTLDQIHEFMKTPDGIKGLSSFKAMRMQSQSKRQSSARPIGDFI